MNSTTTENKQLVNGLKINLHSFELPYGQVLPNDIISVGITTLPEKNKQHFEIQASKIHNCDHVFTINITNETKKILFLFRRKDSESKYPIIASTIINSKHFPKMAQNIYQTFSGTKTNDIQKYKIFEPVQKYKQAENNQKVINHRQVGDMKVILELTSAYPTVKETKTNNDLKPIKKTNNKHSDIKFNSKYQKLKKDVNIPIFNSNN